MHTDMPVNFEKILPDAVAAIIQLQDAEAFFTWMNTNIHRYATTPPPQQHLFHDDATYSEQDLQALAQIFARLLWNVTPLPRNNFHAEPLPLPGRNSPCPCGSGRKFKHCCLSAYQGAPPLSAEELWPLILAELDEKGRMEAVRSKQLPIEMLTLLATDYLEQDQPKKGLKLIEPLFQPDISGTSHHYEFALNTLCNIYDRLGYNNKKTKLLEKIINQPKRSPLRSGAWQRISAIRMDTGDHKGSWKALQHAQRDAPGDPYLGVLEIQLLLSENKSKEARNRAIFWKKKLGKTGGNDEMLQLFSAVAEDPHKAFFDLTARISNLVDEELPGLIAQGIEQALPDYNIQLFMDAPDKTPQDLTRELEVQLQNLGIPTDEIEALLNDLPEAGQDEDELQQDNSAIVITPAAIKELEATWINVFPLGKPFSTHEHFLSDIDPWEAEFAGQWTTWLKNNPEAFGSLDILDDLATALLSHPAGLQPWITEKMLAPVLKRAIGILEYTLDKTDTEVILKWPATQNRPALRSLSRIIHMERSSYDDTAARRYAERLLQLNPEDNHGVRTLLINYYLQANENEKVLTLAAQFPEDMHPDIPFGKALALFRLDRKEEAGETLVAAMEDLPKVVPMLRRKNVRQPKLSEYGIQIGGNDQAWLYREEARELWEETPGAMEWLKKQRKK